MPDDGSGIVDPAVGQSSGAERCQICFRDALGLAGELQRIGDEPSGALGERRISRRCG